MTSLSTIFSYQLAQSRDTSPAPSIFEKIEKLDALLLEQIFDEAIKAQRDRKEKVVHLEEMREFMKQPHPRQKPLSFPQQQQQQQDRAPQRLERRMHLPPPDRITTPHPATPARFSADAFTIDMIAIDDDLRSAIVAAISGKRLHVDLTEVERQSLGLS